MKDRVDHVQEKSIAIVLYQTYLLQEEMIEGRSVFKRRS
jgi:hypothetical protein